MKFALNRPRHLLSMTIGLYSLALLAGSASADAKRGQLSASDYQFVVEAAQGARTEFNLGQLAARKSADSNVRRFAERIVQDHQAASQELTRLAIRRGATLPDPSSKKERRILQYFGNLSGLDFDKAFIKTMINDHKQDVIEFQKAVDKVADAELKDWATSTLPILQEHLILARNAEAKLLATK